MWLADAMLKVLCHPLTALSLLILFTSTAVVSNVRAQTWLDYVIKNENVSITLKRRCMMVVNPG